MIFALVGACSKAYAAPDIHTSGTLYVTPFGLPENFHPDIKEFYKWTGVLIRIDSQRTLPLLWQENQKSLLMLPLIKQVQKINIAVNQYPYVSDLKNWQQNDYWEIPPEFFLHGGDCEDYVIAKYAWLKSIGVPEDMLRLAIVYDRVQELNHSVLIIFMDQKAMILDNQIHDIRDSGSGKRYRLIFSINRRGWWSPKERHARVDTMRDKTEQFSAACSSGLPLPECIDAMEPTAKGRY